MNDTVGARCWFCEAYDSGPGPPSSLQTRCALQINASFAGAGLRSLAQAPSVQFGGVSPWTLMQRDCCSSVTLPQTYTLTWHHPQNRKYISVTSQKRIEPRPKATRTKFAEVLTCGFRDTRVDRRTDGQDTLIALLRSPTVTSNCRVVIVIGLCPFHLFVSFICFLAFASFLLMLNKCFKIFKLRKLSKQADSSNLRRRHIVPPSPRRRVYT